MTWTKLIDLPDRRMPTDYNPNKSYWEVIDGKVVHQGRPNRTADVESFELLDGSDFVARDKNYVYHAWSTLKSVDRDTFEYVGDGYFRDKTLAYCEYETSIKPLKGSTVEGFKVLGNSYARDKNLAYYCGRAIVKCTSPMTLELVEQTGHHPIFAAKDAVSCYYEGAQLKDADPNTWVMGENGFSTDANGVYFGSKRLGKVHPKNWKRLKRPYSTDGKNVYWMHMRLQGADVASFEVLPDGTARDKISIFVGKKRG